MDLIKLTIIDCHKVWEWSKISLARMENYLAHRHTSVLTCDQWTTCILQHIYIFVNAFLLLHMLEFFIKNIQLRVVLFLFHLLQIFYRIFYIFLSHVQFSSKIRFLKCRKETLFFVFISYFTNKLIFCTWTSLIEEIFILFSIRK